MLAANKRPVDIARHLGIKDAAVHQWFAKDRGPKSDRLPALAAFLGTSADHLLGSSPRDMRPRTGQNSSNEMQAQIRPAILPARGDMPEDVPILGTALGGETGAFVMLGEAGYIRRPPRMAGRTDVFALFVQGTSMDPRYLPGELIYLEKRRAPQPGDHVVIEMRPDKDGQQEAFLKRLVAVTPTKLRVAQYNPAKTIEIDRKAILQVIRVMTLADIF